MSSAVQIVAHGVRWLTGGAGALPAYLVVGTKRGGSTSLQAYLAAHPSVRGPVSGKGTHYFDVHHRRGQRWYRSQFPARAPGSGWIAGEASPYYMFHPGSLDWIAQELPGVKLIVLLRDPVDRAHSHYQHEVARGFEHLSFDDALDAEPARVRSGGDHARRHFTYLQRGHYLEHLREMHRRFPPERVLVLQSEELFRDPRAAVSRTCDFLGIPDADVGELRPHKALAYEPLAPATRERLASYFFDRNAGLYAYLGRDLGWTRPTIGAA